MKKLSTILRDEGLRPTRAAAEKTKTAATAQQVREAVADIAQEAKDLQAAARLLGKGADSKSVAHALSELNSVRSHMQETTTLLNRLR